MENVYLIQKNLMALVRIFRINSDFSVQRPYLYLAFHMNSKAPNRRLNTLSKTSDEACREVAR